MELIEKFIVPASLNQLSIYKYIHCLVSRSFNLTQNKTTLATGDYLFVDDDNIEKGVYDASLV